MQIKHSQLRLIIRESLLREYPEGTCPSCGKTGMVGKKFCGRCGAKLGQCPKCSAPLNNSPTQKFCGKCSEKLFVPKQGDENTAATDKEAEKIQSYVKSEAETLLDEIERILPKAPERPSKEENRLYDDIMGNYFKDLDEIMEADPDNPKEFRIYMKNIRDHVRQVRPKFIKLYNAVKDEGKILSKPFLELLSSSLKAEVEAEMAAAGRLKTGTDLSTNKLAATNKQIADERAEHEKKMAAMTAEFERKKAELYKLSPQQKIIDDFLNMAKKK